MQHTMMFVRSVPDLGRSMPDLRLSMPDLGRSMPDLRVSVPDPGPYATHKALAFGGLCLTLGLPMPDLGRYIPDLGRSMADVCALCARPWAVDARPPAITSICNSSLDFSLHRKITFNYNSNVKQYKF